MIKRFRNFVEEFGEISIDEQVDKFLNEFNDTEILFLVEALGPPKRHKIYYDLIWILQFVDTSCLKELSPFFASHYLRTRNFRYKEILLEMINEEDFSQKLLDQITMDLKSKKYDLFLVEAVEILTFVEAFPTNIVVDCFIPLDFRGALLKIAVFEFFAIRNEIEYLPEILKWYQKSKVYLVRYRIAHTMFFFLEHEENLSNKIIRDFFNRIYTKSRIPEIRCWGAWALYQYTLEERHIDFILENFEKRDKYTAIYKMKQFGEYIFRKDLRRHMLRSFPKETVDEFFHE